MSYVPAIIFYLLGFHMAWDLYNIEAELSDMEVKDRISKLAMFTTCALWPIVELRGLFDRGE